MASVTSTGGPVKNVLVRLSGLLALIWTALWLPAALVSLWWISTSESEAFYYPPLQSVLATFGQDWLPWVSTEAFLGGELLVTLRHLGAGLSIAVAAGVLLGLLIGSSAILWTSLRPLLELARAVPTIIFFPIVFLVFGFSGWGNVSIVAFSAVWPVILNTIDGVRAVDPLLHDLAKSYRLTHFQRMTTIVLRSASPQIMTGIRVATAFAVIAVVASEYFIGGRGVGYYVFASQYEFRVTETWAGTILLGLIGYALSVTVRAVERAVLGWHFQMRRPAGRAH